MEIILLHSAQVEASRNVLAELPPGAIIIDKHSEAVAACPNFAAYPALVVKDGDTMRVLSPFSTWAEAQAFIDNPPAPVEPSKQVEYTQLDFLYLFTPQEQVALKAAEAMNPAVGVFWEAWRGASTIRTDDPRTIAAVDMLASTSIGIITQARADEILGRETQAG